MADTRRVINPDGTVITMEDHKTNRDTRDGGIGEAIEKKELTDRQAKMAENEAMRKLEKDPQAYALFLQSGGKMSATEFLAHREAAVNKGKEIHDKAVKSSEKEKETAKKTFANAEAPTAAQIGISRATGNYGGK